MQSDQFPPGGNSDPDESPTIRVRPPTPGSAPTPPQPPQADPYGATQRPQLTPQTPASPYGPPSAPPASAFGPPGVGTSPGQQAGGFPPMPPPQAPPQPGFMPSQPGMPQAPAGPPQPGFGTMPQPGVGAPAQPAFGAPPQPQQWQSQPQPGYGAPPAVQSPGVTFPAPPPPGFGGAPPGFDGAPQGFGPPQPGYGAPPPGYGAPPKKRTGLIVIIAVVLLVVIIGGVIGFLLLKKGGSGSSSTIPLTTYTSPDNTFSIGYPTGWQQKTPSSDEGSGVEFIGPASQEFIITDLGSVADLGGSLTPALLDSAFCQGGAGSGGGAGGAPTAPQMVNIGGQNWTEEECDNSTGEIHAAVETVFYKNQAYLIAYASPKASFGNDRSQFYSAMEQSFKFLS